MVIVPERAASVLAAVLNETVPLPVPLGVTPVIHASLGLAVHAHDGSLAVRLTEFDSASAPTEALELASVNEHALFVRVKSAGDAAPTTLALTTYMPAVPFAVTDDVATPIEFVVVEGLPRVAEAPEDGAVKVTLAMGTALP
jgi:hypothetical protein